VRIVDGAVAVATARGRITVMTPRAFEARFAAPPPGDGGPHLAAFRIAGANTEALAARLTQAGVPHRLADGVVQVPASAAFGVTIEFR
jgi:hypothetical protein